MKKFLILSLACVAGAANADTLFYGGDYQGDATGQPLANQQGGGYTQSRVYDDFTLSSASTITSLFANIIDPNNTRDTTAYWEIRSGVSNHNGGTLLFSGTTATSAVATGRTSAGSNEYTYSSTVNFNLNAGTYWMTYVPIGGSSIMNLSTTTGANHVGGPFHNGNSFLDSTDFGTNFAAVNGNEVYGSGTWDFSLGVVGTAAVPEPTTIAALGLGAVALIRRRKKA